VIHDDTGAGDFVRRIRLAFAAMLRKFAMAERV
jgi:hypothetical protein